MIRYLLIASLICLAACEKNSSKETAVVTTQAQGKPIVSFVPMIDHSGSHLNWNLSDELSLAVQQHLVSRGELYLIHPDKISVAVKKLSDDNDPFTANTEWIKRAFRTSEFVVFSELVEHREAPISTRPGAAAEDLPATLGMVVRLRVFDVRGETARPVLQEFVRFSEHLPRQFTEVNFLQVPWGSETFEVSPLGVAHAALAREIGSRVEDYILLNR